MSSPERMASTERNIARAANIRAMLDVVVETQTDAARIDAAL